MGQNFSLNGTDADTTLNKQKLKKLNVLDDKDVVTIDKNTKIIFCEFNGPAGSNPYIVFNIDGNKFEGDFSLESEKKEICDENGIPTKIIYKLYPY
jgi:hypothetical protein